MSNFAPTRCLVAGILTPQATELVFIDGDIPLVELAAFYRALDPQKFSLSCFQIERAAV